MVIKAPFNFVPVYDKVFFPDWANCISHDIPFEDGVSGTIKVKITAKTPIFVRNGHTQAEADEKSDACKQFSNVDGKYFIPGTSIKGAVRSVLEIMSFGKMSTQETHKYAHREWNCKELYRIQGLVQKLDCGWLKKNSDGTYCVLSCGKPWRISFKELDKYLGKNLFEQNFSKEKGVSSASLNDAQKKAKTTNHPKEDPKTAMFKYLFFDNLNKKRDDIRFSKIPSQSEKQNKRNVCIDENGNMTGSIVLTGQPDVTKFSNREMGSGKFYEFIFENKVEKEYLFSEEQFQDLVSIYKENPEWNYHLKNLETKGIPIFFRVENGEIFDCGLAFMYKEPYLKSPADCIPSPSEHNSLKHDLAECMFGYVSKDVQSLKGRVQFGHAWCTRDSSTDERKYVLATPKSSYHPLYALNGSQWKDGTLIAGRKRYIVRTREVFKSLGSEAMESEAEIVNQGAEFEERISFHNLKKAELGALLCALTFDGHTDCLHSIGQGKPFGWGSVSIEIDSVNTDVDDIDRKDCIDQFKKSIKFVDNWEGVTSIRELFELAKPIEAKWNNDFSYMNLDEFAEAKQNKEHLERISKLRARLNNPVDEKPKTKGPSNAPKTKMSALLKNARRGF